MGQFEKHFCFLNHLRLTWGIEKKQLSIEGGYKIESTVEKLLQEKDSALDNRNQHDRNKDAEQMAKGFCCDSFV